MLGLYDSLLSEIIEFTNLKTCSLTKLKDENWLRDLGFIVHNTKHLYDLNVQLQGLDQLLHSMLSKIDNAESLRKLV